ncbi:MAG: Fic family protein [Candidatus Daviesbacteria bacterium]|nr:MAG: Fic family protein [Candidatus Daviesbacteria bacterium]
METYSKIQVDEGERKDQVVFGGQRAMRFVKDVVAGKAVDGRRYKFDSDLIMELHRRVAMAPGIVNFLRQTDSTTVGGETVGSYRQLEVKMQLFGRWLGEEMELLKENSEDIVLALYIAASVHYGLTQPGFHPFDNGNGRTGRALMNMVLMSQSYELTALGMAIPPIPIIRTDKDEGHYIRSLRAAGQTKTMNPFMTFIAQKWLEFLKQRMENFQAKVKNPKTDADKKFFDKMERRRELLEQFIHAGNRGDSEYQVYPIPDYFAPRHIKFSYAETV